MPPERHFRHFIARFSSTPVFSLPIFSRDMLYYEEHPLATTCHIFSSIYCARRVSFSVSYDISMSAAAIFFIASYFRFQYLPEYRYFRHFLFHYFRHCIIFSSIDTAFQYTWIDIFDISPADAIFAFSAFSLDADFRPALRAMPDAAALRAEAMVRACASAGITAHHYVIEILITPRPGSDTPDFLD